MQVETKKIIKYCEDYLKVSEWQDKCQNGLQIEGVSKTSKIITGVSLSSKLIEEAIKRKAKMIIVHHGLFSSAIPTPPQIKGFMRDRLKMLLENNINLLGFHLPLDAHPAIGNNISLLKLFGLKKVGVIDDPRYGTIGYVGELKESKKFIDFVDMVDEKLNTNSYAIAAGPKKIKTIGIVSGGAASDYKIAHEQGADTFICGDVREDIIRAVEETKINFINAGHYNTEKLGVINLGNLIAKKFDVKVEFVDIPNEI